MVNVQKIKGKNPKGKKVKKTKNLGDNNIIFLARISLATADVCEECYGCKEVFANAEFLDEEGEYCEGVCKECSRSVLDKVDSVVELRKK